MLRYIPLRNPTRVGSGADHNAGPFVRILHSLIGCEYATCSKLTLTTIKRIQLGNL